MSRTDDREAAARERGERVPACPACGARARREGARFCSTCGRSLRERGYRPADGLRASYRWQTAAELSRRGREGAGPRGFARNSERLSAALRPRPRADEISRRARLTSANRRPRAARRNGPTESAYVLITYALMPYVGVVFCPAAAVCGAVGMRRARRERHPAAEREAEQSVAYAILLFGAQALLWGFMFLAPLWFG